MPKSDEGGQGHTEYNLPRNDAAEFARLDDQANGYTELMKERIIHAPLESPRKLLDVGCGTGIVCRQIASRYPNATVYGVDISPVPPHSGTPENVVYITGDIKKLAGDGVNHDDNHESSHRLNNGEFDYIYQRLLICGMTDWPGYIRQMASLLRSGGWMEIHDYAEIWYQRSPDGEEKVISTNWAWQAAMRRGASQLGLDLDIGINARQYMEEAGLVDIQVVKYPVPFGDWMVGERPETKLIGEHQVGSMGEVFSQSIMPGVTRGLGLGEEEVQGLKGECRRCLGEGRGKFWWFYVTWGKKV